MKLKYPKLVKVYTVEINLSSGQTIVHDFVKINVKTEAGKVTSMHWTESKYSFMSADLSSIQSVRVIATKRRIRWVALGK